MGRVWWVWAYLLEHGDGLIDALLAIGVAL
jgi:hypothetical protein